MSMAASYWVAKYVEDPFRNETRNVGVFVRVGDVVAARFLGEREDGIFDARKIGKQFSHPQIYMQWRRYWRTQLHKEAVEGLTRHPTPNYFVQVGGKVSDTGSDSADEVCHFLFNLLVGGGPVDAFEWNQDDESEVALADDIVSALQSRSLFNSERQELPHPVEAGVSIRGGTVTHSPSFSQRNGRLYVIEHIDLSTTRLNKTKERAGWMGYMFSDIRDINPDAVPYSIVRPAQGGLLGQIEYARTFLESQSKVVNWADREERDKFLNERETVALTLDGL